MVDFTNEPIPLDQTPELHDDAFVPVDRRHLRVRLVAIGLTAVIVSAACAVASAWAEVWQVGTAAAVLLVALALAAALAVAEMRRLAYQLREHDVSLRSGVVIHRTETIPFSRVQHVNLTRGPIERAIGLASLEVTSAGPNIVIPGLAIAEAERVKQLVSERADVAEPGEA
ncbi:MAG: PH domain-containing protein [Ilumatobacter sp.]|uniref:PH domain-containing protein n=1 Tax=Ilumatobacter sp. TaxID=1967498 RepID=UPI003C78FE63